MRHITSLSISTLLLFATPHVARAVPYADDMAKCLVASTSAEDKSALVQWIFVMMALHPDVKQLANVSDTQRTDSSRNIASISETLLTKSCLSETRDAIKYEGSSTIESSFTVLGQVAARELFTDPGVIGGMSEFGKMLDNEKVHSAIGLIE